MKECIEHLSKLLPEAEAIDASTHVLNLPGVDLRDDVQLRFYGLEEGSEFYLVPCPTGGRSSPLPPLIDFEQCI